jgi:hypothetical protein
MLTQNTYKLLPIQVSSGFRSLVMATYPALEVHSSASVYWRMMQYCLFSHFMDRETGKLILPYTTVAALVGVNAHTHGFNASEWIEAFSRDVMPLDSCDHRYSEGQARIINPQISPDVLSALAAERQRDDNDGEAVWFATGVPVSRRNLRAAQDDYGAYLLALSQGVDETHPAYDLIQYLLAQPQGALEKVLKANWPFVREAVRGLPMSTESERATREWCDRVLDNLDTFRRVYYADSPKTPRIFAVGTNVLQLPRAVRKVAFAGQVEMDLSAAQLAVVARLWGIPELQTVLESGMSIWTELLTWIDKPTTYKAIVKRTVYSIVFGMGRKKLVEQLAQGDSQDDGVGEDAAERFFLHPLAEALLKARSRQRRAVEAAGGAEDGFGRWVAVEWVTPSRRGKRKRKNTASVLASVVQSYELRLMLSILPVLQAEPQIYLLAWLHDGITLHFGNGSKQERQIRRICRAVQERADAYGMATHLEVEYLPTPAQIVGSNLLLWSSPGEGFSV